MPMTLDGMIAEIEARGWGWSLDWCPGCTAHYNSRATIFGPNMVPITEATDATPLAALQAAYTAALHETRE